MLLFFFVAIDSLALARAISNSSTFSDYLLLKNLFERILHATIFSITIDSLAITRPIIKSSKFREYLRFIGLKVCFKIIIVVGLMSFTSIF